MIKILTVDKGSLAERNGIRSGDQLLTLNGQKIEDILDYRYEEAGDEVAVVVERAGERIEVEISKEYDASLGLQLTEPRIRACPNDCIFCFIKQNPPGMRRSIYFCDEDYRQSFLHGSYITLSNLSDRDLERIVRLRLSPLYVSVHATDPAVRERIFRFRREDRLMEKLRFLDDHHIELHTQIVLIPGINDGEVLEGTLSELAGFQDSIRTVAIVPVGLTRHRQRLPKLETITPGQAAALIAQSERWDQRFRDSDDLPLVYLADEFYLLAGREFPPSEHYGDFQQIENGVGLVREFLDSFAHDAKHLPRKIPQQRRVLLITGMMAAPVLQVHIQPRLNRIENLQVDIQAIRNDFFGDTVTVAGLLTGQDILAQVANAATYDLIFLPPRCINMDGILLDDYSPDQLMQKLGVPVMVAGDDFREMVNRVAK